MENKSADTSQDRREADRLYERNQGIVKQYQEQEKVAGKGHAEQMIRANKPLGYSREQIQEHVHNVNEVNREKGTHLEADKTWGKSKEELKTLATHRQHVAAGNKGKATLERKYGKEAAKEIISKHKK